MSHDRLCVVCPAPGTLRCSRCKGVLFCTREHQALLWPTHKHLCRSGKALVFAQPSLDPAELQRFIRREGPGGPVKAVVQRLKALMHATTTDERAALPRVFVAETTLGAGGLPNLEAVSFEVADQTLWASYERIIASTPPPGVTDILTFVRAWLYLSASPALASHESFARTSALLAARTPSPSSLLASVDPDLRTAFELQTLVLCTLIDCEAPGNLLEVALERLGDLVGDQEGLKGVWRSAGEMVGRAIERKNGGGAP